MWGFAKLSGHFLMELELNLTGIWLTGIVIIFSALGRITDLDSDDWIINSHQLHSIMNPKLEVFGSQCVRRRCAKLSSFDQDQHWSSSKDNTTIQRQKMFETWRVPSFITKLFLTNICNLGGGNIISKWALCLQIFSMSLFKIHLQCPELQHLILKFMNLIIMQLTKLYHTVINNVNVAFCQSNPWMYSQEKTLFFRSIGWHNI